jgi:hypothetical protein
MVVTKLQKLIEQREAVNARIRLQQNRLKATERRADTRRKVLAGAAVLEWAKRDEAFSARLMSELDTFLVRENDRQLFGLSPSVQPKAAAS